MSTVAILTTQFPDPPINGVRIPMYNLALELERSGHRVVVFHFDPPEGRPRWGIESVQLPSATPLELLAHGCMFPLAMRRFAGPKAGEVFHQKIQELQADAVVAHRIHTAPLLSGLEIPKSLIIQDVVSAKLATDLPPGVVNPRRVMLPMNRRLFRRQEREFFCLFDHSYVVSEAEARKAAAVLPSSRPTVLPNGVVHGALGSLGSFPSQATIGYLGSLSNPRNEAAAWLLATLVLPEVQMRRPDVQLRIVGNGPSERLIALAAVDPAISLSGRVDDVHAAVEQLTCVVNPQAKGSGIKNSVLDCATMGRPLVLSSVAADGTGLVDGRDFLNANSVSEIVDAACSILDDPDLAMRLATCAKSHVDEIFSWSSYASKILLDLLPGAARE